MYVVNLERFWVQYITEITQVVKEQFLWYAIVNSNELTGVEEFKHWTPISMSVIART